jgi:hypothetical protein
VFVEPGETELLLPWTAFTQLKKATVLSSGKSLKVEQVGENYRITLPKDRHSSNLVPLVLKIPYVFSASPIF